MPIELKDTDDFISDNLDEIEYHVGIIRKRLARTKDKLKASRITAVFMVEHAKEIREYADQLIDNLERKMNEETD